MRAWIKRAGLMLTALSFLYIGQRLWVSQFWEIVPADSGALFVYIATSSLVFGMSAILLALAWANLVSSLAAKSMPLQISYPIFARTQIIKYVPGNVFHFIARHARAHDYGYSHGALFWAAISETVGLMLAAGLIALLGLMGSMTSPEVHQYLWLGVAGIGLTLIGVLAAARLMPLAASLLIKSLGKEGEKWAESAADFNIQISLMTILRSIPYYLLYFAIMGLIGWGLDAIMGTPQLTLLPLYTGAIAASWLLGYIIPGASGGLGVREAVMMALLSIHVPVETTIIVAFGLRLITVLADVVFFVLGYVFSADGAD